MVHFSQNVWGDRFTYAGDPLFCTMFPDTEMAKKDGSEWSHKNEYSCGDVIVRDDSNYIAS